MQSLYHIRTQLLIYVFIFLWLSKLQNLVASFMYCVHRSATRRTLCFRTLLIEIKAIYFSIYSLLQLSDFGCSCWVGLRLDGFLKIYVNEQVPKAIVERKKTFKSESIIRVLHAHSSKSSVGYVWSHWKFCLSRTVVQWLIVPFPISSDE